MANSLGKGFNVPYRNSISDVTGLLTQPWQSFFRALQFIVAPLGYEISAPISNNVSSPANIDGMIFSPEKVNQAVVEYFIQRVTSGGGATALYAAGIFHVVYKPTAGTWHIVTVGTPGPDSSGITFSITTEGQVQYTSTNITGTANISKITWRARTLGAKVAI